MLSAITLYTTVHWLIDLHSMSSYTLYYLYICCSSKR